jgi:predicted dehydrogenase
MTALRAAVVGAGVISAEHLSFLARSDRARLVAVCDRSPVSARYSAERYGADSWHVDVDALLAETRPEVVHVLTPPHTHPDLVARALEAGTHVVCEKPLAPTGDEASRLLDLADRRDRRLVESHNYRFNPTIAAIDELIGSGRLGPVTEVEVRIALPISRPGGRLTDPLVPSPLHAMPAGAVHDYVTHLAYLARHLAPGVELGRVAAAWSNHGGGERFRFDDLDALLVGDGPDGPVHVRLRFDSLSGPDAFSVTVRGRRGTVHTDLFQPHLLRQVERPVGPKLTPVVNQVASGWALVRWGVGNVRRKLAQEGPYVGLHRMLDQVYAALGSGQEPPVTRADIEGAARLVDRLLAAEVRL